MTDLTKETYENVLAMLCSEDDENMVVGLKCIEQLDKRKNLLFILLLRKHSFVTDKQWIAEAPLTDAFLRQLTMPSHIPIMPYTDILSLVKGKPEISKESLKVLLEHIVKSLEKRLIHEQKDLVEELKITIKFKDDD